MKTKAILILAFMALLAACSTSTEQNGKGNGSLNDSLNADLNHFKTNTLFDSIPVKSLPYADSISADEALPVHRIKMTPKQLAFLNIRNIRELNEYYATEPDSAFALVCRLPLSGNYFSIVINFSGPNESLNYLINYDREYRIIDYLMTAYAETMETSMRTSASVDTTGLIIRTGNLLKEAESMNTYRYSITEEGFFREEMQPVADAK